MELQEIDGFSVKVSGDLPTLVTFHRDVHGVVAAVAALLADRKINIASMTLHRKTRGGMASLVAEMEMEGNPDPALPGDVAKVHPAIVGWFPSAEEEVRHEIHH